MTGGSDMPGFMRIFLPLRPKSGSLRFHADLSTPSIADPRWLEGSKILNYKSHPQEDRNRISEAMFKAWWLPFSRFGVNSRDPHLGNYTVFEDGGRPGGINLLDYGCIRLFPVRFIGGVVDLYQGC